MPNPACHINYDFKIYADTLRWSSTNLYSLPQIYTFEKLKPWNTLQTKTEPDAAKAGSLDFIFICMYLKVNKKELKSYEQLRKYRKPRIYVNIMQNWINYSKCQLPQLQKTQLSFHMLQPRRQSVKAHHFAVHVCSLTFPFEITTVSVNTTRPKMKCFVH